MFGLEIRSRWDGETQVSVLRSIRDRVVHATVKVSVCRTYRTQTGRIWRGSPFFASIALCLPQRPPHPSSKYHSSRGLSTTVPALSQPSSSHSQSSWKKLPHTQPHAQDVFTFSSLGTSSSSSSDSPLATHTDIPRRRTFGKSRSCARASSFPSKFGGSFSFAIRRLLFLDSRKPGLCGLVDSRFDSGTRYRNGRTQQVLQISTHVARRIGFWCSPGRLIASTLFSSIFSHD